MNCLKDRPENSLFDDVTQAARRRLSESPYATIRRVSCEYDGGMLRLRGHVPTFYHKQLAQEAVADLDGVLQVVNQTEVAATVL
jgi:osmotically-inducible protein OsmY